MFKNIDADDDTQVVKQRGDSVEKEAAQRLLDASYDSGNGEQQGVKGNQAHDGGSGV